LKRLGKLCHRQAVPLVGGDKTGNARFYLAMVMVPFAEAIWEQPGVASDS
jgi:hypothetical protein